MPIASKCVHLYASNYKHITRSYHCATIAAVWCKRTVEGGLQTKKYKNNNCKQHLVLSEKH